MLKKDFEKLKKLWSKQCFCTKTLILIGLIGFFHIVIEFLLESKVSTESDLVIRSVLVSIMGYLFGSKVIVQHNNSEKISVVIAALLAGLSMIILGTSELFYISQKTQNAIALRGVLSSSVGFLISKSSKAKEDHED